MKIKSIPEDFVVSEVADIYPEQKGEYSLYLLKKKNISSWDAIGKIAKLLRISANSIGYGGLKDKKALANQFITIKNGPKKDIKTQDFELIYLGKTTKCMTKNLLKGNFFEIIVREVNLSEDAIEREVNFVKTYGLPNYFDEQRFGSLLSTKEFAAKEIIKKNYEKALYLMLAEASPIAIEKTRKFRECLKKNWGNFERCKDLATLSWEKELMEFLSTHPSSKRTFKRALNLVDREYLFFLGNVYQSYLWNKILGRVIESLVQSSLFKVSYLLGEFNFYKELPEEVFLFLKNLKIPLPSPKLDLNKLPERVRDCYLKVLNEEGFSEIKELRTFIKGLIFKTYPRPALLFPEKLSWEKVDKESIKISFFLEKGAYATLVVKRIVYGCENP